MSRSRGTVQCCVRCWFHGSQDSKVVVSHTCSPHSPTHVQTYLFTTFPRLPAINRLTTTNRSVDALIEGEGDGFPGRKRGHPDQG